MEIRTYQNLKFSLSGVALSDNVQHSCASRITKFHHLPLRYMGRDSDLGESTDPSDGPCLPCRYLPDCLWVQILTEKRLLKCVWFVSKC
jgi:hypothetical protein